ncbi:MAG: DNA topoisomerase VI subunit B [Promethearchaeati archaeon SRVP18_Atabeyarchaeia-1]
MVTSPADQITELSPSEWFIRNRNIAGFDNAARALYTALRELVENGLDACEASKTLPEVQVSIRREQQDKKDPTVYVIRVEDHGVGVAPDSVPTLFGKILTGTKMSLKQHRGHFGLGGKMAFLYAQVTTQSPIKVITCRMNSHKVATFMLKINIQKNEPSIIERKIIPVAKFMESLKKQEARTADQSKEKKPPRKPSKKDETWHGTIIELSLMGDWQRSKSKILEYFKRTAIIVPYANLTLETPDLETYHYSRATESLPEPPIEILPHPHGVDTETLARMILISKSSTLSDFLLENFHRVGEKTAEDFLKFAELNGKKNPRKLSRDEIVKLMESMEKYDKFLPPDPRCLSPIGEEILITGIKKELSPAFVTAVSRSPSVYGGHAFIVEVALAYGGQIANGINLYRFSNRIPLLYDEGSDVTSKVSRELDWRRYHISQEMPIAIFIHLASTKIPYKTVGKEYIAEVDEIKREIDLGLKECARRLSIWLSKRERSEYVAKRLTMLRDFYAFIASTLERSLSRKVEIEKLFNNNNHDKSRVAETKREEGGESLVNGQTVIEKVAADEKGEA